MRNPLLGAVFITLLLQLPAVFLCETAGALTARQIMEKVENRDDGDNQTTDMKMVLTDRHGNERVRKISAFAKDEGESTVHRLMFFTYPADIEGTGFLTVDHETRDDQMWLYLPALHKTKQISSQNQNDSFMGSDLNYSDMTSRNLDDFSYSFYEQKEMTVRGEKVWVINAIPKSEEIIEETGYEKSLLLVRQDNYCVVRIIRWEAGGDYMKYIDVNKLERIDGIWFGTSIVVNRKRGNEFVHQTVLTFDNVKFDQDLSLDLFTVRRLEKGL